MNRGDELSSGSRRETASEASSGKSNDNSRSPSTATSPRPELGLRVGLVAVKQEMVAATSAPSGKTNLDSAPESTADDKSLVRRLEPDTWSQPSTHQTASQDIASMPISHPRISHDGLLLGQISAGPSQDTPAGRPTVHDGALPGHVEAMRDNLVSADSAARIGMVTETRGVDSNGAKRGTTETAMDRDAQRTSTFAQTASRVVDHSVSSRHAVSSDRGSGLNYPGTASVQEHITVCSGVGIRGLDLPTLSPRAESHAGVGELSRPKTAAEQNDLVGARSESFLGLSGDARHAGASLETSSGAGLNAGGSHRLAPGTTTIATAPRPGTTGLRDTQGNYAEGSGQDQGDDANKTSADTPTSRADVASGLPPASSVPRRSNQPASPGHGLTGGQPALPGFTNAKKSSSSEGGVSAASGLAGGSGSGVNSQKTAQSGSAIPSVVAERSYFLPMDFLAGTALPADDISVRGSRGSLGIAQHSATDNAGGGASHSAGSSGSSVEMETAPAESLPSAFNREHARVRQEQLRLASLEEHTMDDSAGDTVNVALAALSYADAAASVSPRAAFGSPTPVGAANESARQDRQSFSCSAGGELTISREDRGIATMENLAPPEHEQVEGGGSAMSSVSATAPIATRFAAGASARSEESSQDALASLGSAAPIVVPLPSSTTQAAFGGIGSSTISRREKGARARDRRDDMMHAMCMICLEKLSEPADGGGAKLLGLLDSCTHRYCYQCILEWSKITNKCPQCASRFHTIKAVKELRRNNNRYRGVAVNVEDRDQVYSFVDLRDVVVLDPDVACYPDCLLRGAADAFQQPGWEFSVQCEQCSDWFHGVCAGYREEQAVPDRWFCNPCRGESHQTAQSPGTVAAPAARATASSRGRGSSSRSRARGRGRGRGRGGRQNRLSSSVSAQVQEQGRARGRDQAPEQDASDVSCGALSRTVADGRQAASTPATEETVVSLSAAPQQPPASPTQLVPSVPAQSAPSPSPMVAAASPRRRGRARGSTVETAVPPQPVLANPTPPAPIVPVQPTPLPSPTVSSAPPSGSGRPRGSIEETAVPLSAALQPAPASATPPIPPAQAQSTPSPSPAVAAAAPSRGRGRPRGSQNAMPSVKPPAVPVTAQTQAQPEPASPPSVPPSVSPPPVPPPPASPPSAPPPHVSPSHGHQEQRKQAQPPLIADQLRAGDAASEGGCAQPSPTHSQCTHSNGVVNSSPGGHKCSHGDEVDSSNPGVPSGLLERPSGLPARPAPSLLRTLEASEMSELCDVCGFDTEPDNLIVYCGSCNMGVHQTCYGISQIPTKEWYCSPCSSGVHPSTLACRFCPVQGGALKRCTDGKWGHILCAFWIPECCFIDPRKMEPIGSINKRGQAGGVEQFLPTFRFRKCYICGTSIGSVIRCHSSSCKFHLHPMCGSRAGSVYMEIETTTKTAADGTELEAVNLVAKCPRHNKNKAIVNRSRKSREAMALAADPLRIAGKTIEIADPEKDGAVVLTGKATWFDQDRSRYCIMRSFSDVGSEGNGGGSSSSGGGSGLEATEGCAHWITVEKLVGAKAVKVDLRNGKRFAVEPPLLAEESGEDTDSDSESRGSHVKSEEKEHEEERKGANRVESGGSRTEESDKEKRDNTAGDEEEERGDHASSVLDEEEPDEAEVRAVAHGKRRGRSQVSPTSSPGAVSAKRTARAGMRTRRENSNSSVELDLQRAQEEMEGAAETPPCPTLPDEGCASIVRDGDEATSENGDNASALEADNSMPIAKHAKQQRRRLLPLPSVQVPEPPIRSDPFSRYPIRGRLKRPPQPPGPQEPEAVGGVFSAKRRRGGEETMEEFAVPATARSDSTSNEADERVIPAPPGSGSASNEGVEGPNEVPAPDDSVPPALTPPEVNERVPPDPTQEPHTSVDVPTASGRASRTEAGQSLSGQASCTAYVVEPGWPNSRDAPGQIPVMRVRTVRITGGKEAMYFASAYAGAAASFACGKRSTSRFTFPFEMFGEVEAARADELPSLKEAAGEPLKVLPQQSCDPVETQEMQRAGDVVQDDVPKLEAAKEVCGDGEVRSARSERAKENREDGYKESEGDEGRKESKGGEGGEGDEAEAAQANGLPKDTMSSSPSQGSDNSEMEDGEIETLPDGRGDIMPPSPRDEGMESVLDVIGQGAENILEVDMAEGTDDPPGSAEKETAGDDSDGSEGVQMPMQEAFAKNMATLSDEVSCGEPEGDNSSFCSFEDVLKRAGDASSSDEDFPDTKLGVHACDSTGGAESNVSAFSPETAQIPQAAQELPHGEGSPEVEVATAEDAPPTPPPSPPDLQQQAATNGLRTIVREQLQDILTSASTGGEAALASGNGAELFRRIAVETEEELFERLYNRSTGGREYKAKYKQLLLSVGNVRNYRLVASVLEGNTTPVDLATKDAVGLLKSLSSSLNCLAIPLAGRNRQGASGRNQRGGGRGSRRGKMRLLG